MATLKEVAAVAQVTMIEALRALKNDHGLDASLKSRVDQAAFALNYELKITQNDVADLAGVGKGTVSYALNGSDLIKPATRQRVIDAAALLGYRPNIMARNLKTNRAGIVGYSWHIHDDPARLNNLLDEFIYRVTIAAEAQHYHLLTFIQPQEDAERVYDELISTNRVDGFILSDVRYDDQRIKRLFELNAPFVAFGGMYLPGANFAYVDVDGKQGIEMVVNHLLSRGHERIGLVNWHPGNLVGDAREVGYRAAMQAAGIAIQDDWIAYTPNILRSASEATAHVMAAKHPPSAIICTNDVMAFGAKALLDERGYHGVALTGYDDDPTAEFLQITSVRQPIAAVSKALFDLLLGEIRNEPQAQRQVVFSPELVIRQSSLGV
mgnify:FL=1